MNDVVLGRWGKSIFSFMLAMSLLVACGTEEEETVIEEQDDEVVEETTANNGETVASEDESDFPVTVTDSAGKEVTIESEPETIVSLQPSNTEISFELGLGDKFIGVSEYCNYPLEVEEIQVVGAQDMDAELILSLLPDLALVTDYHYQNHEDILNQYEDAGIDVLVIDGAVSFEDAYDTIRLIGTATGTSDRADEVILGMQEEIAVIKEITSVISEEDRKKLWVEVSPAPNIFSTGTGTFMHEIIETIHAINAAEEQEGWVSLNEEEIVTLNPDVIITTYGYYVDNPREEVLSRDGWGEVQAFKDERIYDVNNDTVTRPGPRLVEGVETLAKLIYPELFE